MTNKEQITGIHHQEQPEAIVVQSAAEKPIAAWSPLLTECLPPWLIEETEKKLQEKIGLYPEGQVLLFQQNSDIPIGGFISIKTKWDGFAGNLYSVKHTNHNPDGNTLIVTDLFITNQYDPYEWFNEIPGGLTKCLLRAVGDLANKQNVQFILISIPATDAWYQDGVDEEAFDVYMRSIKYIGHLNGKAFVDTNIQKYAHFWGHLVDSDYGAIIKQASLEQFKSYKKTFKPDSWEKISDYQWHCKGTHGIWSVIDDEDILPGYALYEEPRVWVGKSTGI